MAFPLIDQDDFGLGLGGVQTGEQPVTPFSVDDDEFTAITVGDEEVDPDKFIKMITDDDELHNKVLKYLRVRIDDSENAMEQFHGRWNTNERLLQAHIDLEAQDAIVKEESKSGLKPGATPIIIPYAYATCATISTYMMHTFTSRKPVWQVGSHKAESKAAARNQETVLQYQAEYMNVTYEYWKLFNDINAYGLGIFAINWDVVTKYRTRREFLGMGGLGSQYNRKEEVVVYEGNTIQAQDPFMFFPDPRVSMTDVAEKGEFVFFLSNQNRIDMKGDSRYFEEALDRVGGTLRETRFNQSLRNRLRADGGTELDQQQISNEKDKKTDNIWLHQGTIKIIPKDLGLSNDERPQLWWFSIANKDRIVEALPFDVDHETHPVSVTEPYGFGYGFGQIGPVDLIADIQFMISWLFNSHIQNVRTNLNNMWIVDPHRVVLSDIQKPGPGKIIRLKKSAYGTDIRTVLQQLPVSDVTRGHLADAEMMLQMGQLLLGINDNLMGNPQSGGRKTATEIRAFGQAAIGRLGMTSRVISSNQANMRMQFTSNNTQYLTDDFYISITGKDGAESNLRAPDLYGDFTFPVNDGTLPMDRFAELEVWKEILIGAIQSPELQQTYDVAKIFKHIAELGGASDIENFERDPGQPTSLDVRVAEDEQVQRGVDAGNLIPQSV